MLVCDVRDIASKAEVHKVGEIHTRVLVNGSGYAGELC